MLSRFFFFFFVICALVLLATVTIRAEEEENNDDIEARNPLLAVAIRALTKAFKWAAKKCIKDAAMNCKNHWKNPKELIKCGGSYLKSNKGLCVVG